MPVLTALLAGTVVGLLFDRLQVPGGLIIGSMIGAAAATVGFGDGLLELPRPVIVATYVVLGSSIGMTVTRDFLGQVRSVAVGASVSAVLLVVAGLAVAALLASLGIAPDASVLATSPGALSVMAAAGAEQGAGAPVAVFHTVRLVVVLVSLPLLVRLNDVIG